MTTSEGAFNTFLFLWLLWFTCHKTDAECGCMYPYGPGTSDTDVLWTSTIVQDVIFLSNYKHNVWEHNTGDGNDYEVLVDGMTLMRTINNFQWVLQYWAGANGDMKANPGSHIYHRMEFNNTALLDQSKAEVEAAFDITFDPFVLLIVTMANFTYKGGDETTEKNTVQVVAMMENEDTSENRPLYLQINVDIGWWNVNGSYPTLGIAYQSSTKLRTANDGITYNIPGSGTPDIVNILTAGNTGVPGRWMFTPSWCFHANCLGIPNGYLAWGRIAPVGVSNYTSFCHPGYTGQMCQENIDECANNACNNGNCTDGVNSFNCTCEEGYTGLICDVNEDDCVTNPCANGCCLDLVNSYTCVCSPGWSGTNCDSNIDDCDNNQCVNGTCSDLINGYNCTCDEGFTGTHCETNIDDCYLSPCLNGICVDGIAFIACNCDIGFTGRLCDINIDDCETNPCINGCCQDLVNNYTCECNPGWTGTDCVTNIDDCQPDPCLNGTCTDLVNGYNCTCKVGFSGSQCDSRPDPGTFSEWSEYGACSKACDNGIQKRTRQCLREPCENCTCEYILCNTNRCEVNTAETNSTLLLSTSKGMKEVVSEESKLKANVDNKLNMYCSSNSGECCNMVNVRVTNNFGISAFAASDVKFASGFPVQSDTHTVQIRILVYIPDEITVVCRSQLASGDAVRRKRQVSSTPQTVPVSVLESAIGQTLGEASGDLCCYNVFTDTVQLSNAVWGAIIGGGICFTIVFVALLFVVFQARYRQKRSEISDVAEKSMALRYIPTYKGRNW